MRVFFREEMVGDRGFVEGSPSAGKPAIVVQDWLANPVLRGHVDLCHFDPATPAHFKLAHQSQHVERVLEGRKPNGFGNKSKKIAASLPFTTGSMMAAALSVVGTAGVVACSPTSGFHHAGYEKTAGYCTFNGLAVTALYLATEHRGMMHNGKVGILDCDHHFGDGTSAILERGDTKKRLEETSVSVIHRTAGLHFQRRPETSSGRALMVKGFMEWLSTSLEEMRDCDVVLYQAGADPHMADPYGGFLTTEELEARDRRVFSFLKKHQVPVAWNLAGGYQEDEEGGISEVLRIHRNTFLAAIAG